MRKADLLSRQRALQLRSQHLRAALARDASALARPLNRIGAAGTRLARYAREPWMPFAMLATLLLARRLGAGIRLAQQIVWLWRGWHKLQLWLQR